MQCAKLACFSANLLYTAIDMPMRRETLAGQSEMLCKQLVRQESRAAKGGAKNLWALHIVQICPIMYKTVSQFCEGAIYGTYMYL